METLDPELTKTILEKQAGWKLGITPSGKLAQKSCFVQKVMPTIVRLKPDESTAQIVTHSAWTQRLVDQGMLWDLANDSTIHSLSMAQLLFYPQQHLKHPLAFAKKTLHLLTYQTAGWFSVSQILRPTRSFQAAIEAALESYTSDYRLTLERLMKIFDTFGFLWPQKIVLGHRIHAKKTYKVYTQEERLAQLRKAKDEVYSKSFKQHEERTLDQESLSWSIIKRNDVCPIYEFLEDPWRKQIQHVIHECLYRVPIHAPIKLRNYATDTYLSLTKTGISAVPMDQIIGCQYLWRFTWSSRPSPPIPDLEATYQPQFLRCGSTVYLSPAYESTVLTRSLKGDSRLRSVDLIPEDDCDASMLWRIDLPGLGLSRDDDSSTDEGLNMDILIGRCRVVLHRDIIALRQILYLCAVPGKEERQSILAKENGLLTGDSLECCWWIELASGDDLIYHQSTFKSSPDTQAFDLSILPSPLDHFAQSIKDKQPYVPVDPNFLAHLNHTPTDHDKPLALLPSTPTPCTIASSDEDGFDTLADDPRAEPYLRLLFNDKPEKTFTMFKVWKSSSLKQMISRFPSPSFSIPP